MRLLEALGRYREALPVLSRYRREKPRDPQARVVHLHPRAEALAVADGTILAVGSAPELEALAGPGTRYRRLNGVSD